MKQTITLGAGCFWGTQAYFDLTEGVIKTEVGYANGEQKHITYDQVCQGNTNFIEVCKVEFDDKIISFENLLAKYWTIINPLLINQQGNDLGKQYQSAIFYNQNDEDKFLPIILKSKEIIQKKYDKPITTLIEVLTNYVLAESYHQKYLQKNPHGYCHIVLPKKH